jgi:8-oxo-dGTP diphosphatase
VSGARRLLVTLGYLVRDGRLLLLRRPRPPNEGRYSPPGGKTEAGESPEGCLRREFLEETGLTCGRMELAGVLTQVCPGHYDVVMFLFRILDATGELREGDGGPLEWVPLEEVWERPVPAADLLFGRKVLDPTVRFFRARFDQDPEGKVLEADWLEEVPA